MKKPYQRPVVEKREKLGAVSAVKPPVSITL